MLGKSNIAQPIAEVVPRYKPVFSIFENAARILPARL